MDLLVTIVSAPADSNVRAEAGLQAGFVGSVHQVHFGVFDHCLYAAVTQRAVLEDNVC